jgi:hypothetical protein
VRASPGRPSVYLLLAILGAWSALAGACSPRSDPQSQAWSRIAPSMIESPPCEGVSSIEVPGTSNIFALASPIRRPPRVVEPGQHRPVRPPVDGEQHPHPS